jgi:hypothetical protein
MRAVAIGCKFDDSATHTINNFHLLLRCEVAVKAALDGPYESEPGSVVRKVRLNWLTDNYQTDYTIFGVSSSGNLMV